MCSEDKPIKPIFIVGQPRTGSTLWSNIIDCDNLVMRFGEMHFLHPWHRDFRYFLRKKVGNLRKDYNIERLGQMLFLDPSTHGLKGNYWEQIKLIDPYKLYRRFVERVIHSNRSIKDVFRTIVDESTRIRGYSKCLIKFPVFTLYLKMLVEWYPEAKIIHITRDSRATVVSKLNDPGGTEIRIRQYSMLKLPIQKIALLSVILQYIIASRVYETNRNLNNYRLFRYEDLLHAPEFTIKELCRFLHLDFNPNMLYPKKGQPSSITGRKHRGFDKAAASRWQKSLNPISIRMITAITRRGMLRFDYDPKRHPVFRKLNE